MPMHTIEVDDEVMALIKSRAEIFVDNTPNDVLRRILLTPRPGRAPTATAISNEVPSVPGDPPKALEQILQVVSLIRESGLARGKATARVAQHHRVAPQTVTDKYGRQLGMTSDEFDRLVTNGSTSDLARLLLKRFPRHKLAIDAFLSSDGK